MTNEKNPVTGPLREALSKVPIDNLMSMATGMGVSLYTIERFMQGMGIRSDSIDTLAAILGMRLERIAFETTADMRNRCDGDAGYQPPSDGTSLNELEMPTANDTLDGQ